MGEGFIALLGIGLMGLLFGAGLAIAALKFSVEADPKEEAVEELLPGANCGACGYAGCAQFAKTLAQGKARVTDCAACSVENQKRIAAILGVEIELLTPQVAVPLCVGGNSCRDLAQYEGVQDCQSALLLGGSFKSCPWACLGLGSCERACPFDAIRMGKDGLPLVSQERCTACGRCVEVCPVDVFVLWPKDKKVRVLCRNENKGKAVSSICPKGCVGCQACVRVCPVDAIIMQEGRAVLQPERCIQCGLCVGVCPVNCIVDETKKRPKAFIDVQACVGCGVCARVCPVDAISGEAKEPHVVQQEKCIGCGLCAKRCPSDAIHFL